MTAMADVLALLAAAILVLTGAAISFVLLARRRQELTVAREKALREAPRRLTKDLLALDQYIDAVNSATSQRQLDALTTTTWGDRD